MVARHRNSIYFILIGISLLTFSCKVTENTIESQFRESIGVGTQARIDNQTNAILSRYHYSIIRTERSNEIFFETNWVPRLTFPDEVLSGIKEVRTRIIIRARPSARGEIVLGGRPIPVFNITFEGHTEYLLIESNEWVSRTLTESRSQYFKEIAYEFRTQFSGGIRN
jgi:hypothetical protein